MNLFSPSINIKLDNVSGTNRLVSKYTVRRHGACPQEIQSSRGNKHMNENKQ